MIKIHPVFVFILLNNFPFFISRHYQMPVYVMSHRAWPSHDCRWRLVFYLRLALSELSSVRHCFQRRSRDRRESPKRLRCFVVWCNNEHSSRHLLPTSELLKTQWVPLFFKGMHPPIYLNAFMFARIIRDPASAREEVSIKLFYESLQIAFPNNVLVSKFHS